MLPIAVAGLNDALADAGGTRRGGGGHRGGRGEMNTLLDWLEILINRRRPTYGAVVKALTETECQLESAQARLASVIDLANEWESEMAMVSRKGEDWVAELREALTEKRGK